MVLDGSPKGVGALLGLLNIYGSFTDRFWINIHQCKAMFHTLILSFKSVNIRGLRCVAMQVNTFLVRLIIVRSPVRVWEGPPLSK